VRTSGLRNLGLGLLWLLIGLVGTIVDYSTANDGGIYLATSSAILFGVGQVSYGLWQSASQRASPFDLVLSGADIISKALVRSAVVAAQSAGPLSSEKIARLQAILKHVCNANCTAKTIDDVSNAMQLEQIGINDYLASGQLNFNAAMKQAIVRACASALRSDRALTADDQQLLKGVGRALDISDQHFVAAMAELPRTVPASKP
jgi:hypothetical protein